MQGLIGAASGIISNGLSNIVTNRSFFDGAAKAAAWGVVSAYASYGVGEIFKYAPSTVGKEIVQGVTHAFVHGNISQLQGGSFLSGATSGLLSSGISSGITGLGGGDIEQILGGGLGGGIGSAINGENFWQGFGIGISVGAFNHAMHSGISGNGSEDPPRTKEELKRGLALALEQGSITQQEYNTTLNYLENGNIGVIGSVLWDNKVEIGLTLAGSAKLLVGALRSYIGSSAQLSQRVLGQTDAYHRSATFLRNEIAMNGKISFRSFQTLSIKYTTAAGQKFSLGYNWVRNKIIHLSAGN